MEKKLLFDDIKKVAKGIKHVAGEAAVVAADGIKQGSAQVASQVDRVKQEYDIKRLSPVFLDSLSDDKYVMPRMIRIVDTDKQREDNPVCEGSIGFGLSAKGMDVLCLYTKNAPYVGKTFYPSIEEGVFFIDPSNPNLYINLNDYFEFMKSAKVEELNRIAQDLGASYIKVSLKSEKKSFIKQDAKVKAKVKGIGKGEATHDYDNQSYENVEIESETTFKGHAYQNTELHYFKDEKKIQSLIELRSNPDNPIKKKVLTFKYNNSSGIKQKDVAGIEAVISMMNIGGNASISSEIQNESRTVFEYVVEFPE